MTSKYIENKRLWDGLSEIDYLPLYVAAWLSFNAWYRSAYENEDEEMTDRSVIVRIKDEPNSIRNSLLPKLKPIPSGNRFPTSQEEQSFRADIALLHSRLEGYDLISGKGKNKLRITFTDVFLRNQVAQSITTTHSRVKYEVSPKFGKGGGLSGFSTVVTGLNGVEKFRIDQDRYDTESLSSAVRASALNEDQRARILGLYRSSNPKKSINLLDNGEDAITCGSIEFKCKHEDLYAGLIEILYQMRCHLFHGELVPNEKATECYEPAYRILKYILKQVK